MRKIVRRIGKSDGNRQRGATLATTLLMLTVILLLGTAAAQLALQGEKSARNDRDREIALHAAEAALRDAERDIEGLPGNPLARAHLFDAAVLDELLSLGPGDCGIGADNPLLGICRPAADQDAPVWQHLDFLSAGERMAAVPYGRFTGQTFQAGAGILPALPPRYIVEFLPDRQAGADAGHSAYLYRITAVGFGTRPVTQVALQAFYRKLPA